MSPPVRAGLLATVLATAFLAALLALYQWMELLVAHAGGTLSCSINATLDCGPVWGSKAAKAIGDLARMPVAALGLVWGLAASILAGTLAVKAATGGPITTTVAALRATGLAGVLTVVALAIVSLGIGVWCPTCMATYLVVIVFFVSTLRLPGPFGERLGPGIGLAIAVAFASYLALLLPASRSPRSAEDAMAKALQGMPAASVAPLAPLPSPSTDAGAAAATATRTAAAPSAAPIEGDLLGQLMAALPPDALQAMADVALEHKQSKKFARDGAARFAKGPSMAPVEMIEWTDVLCGHCAMFVEQLDDILGRVPPEQVRVEPRQFPLDKECNPAVEHTAGDGIRCTGARALICLEGSPKFFEAQKAMFAEQSSLTKERILAIARPHAPDGKAFDACLKSAATAQKLQSDIEFAVKAEIHGTPHVLLDGKIAPPFGPYLFAYFMTAGRLDHPALKKLPPGNPPRPHDHAH